VAQVLPDRQQPVERDVLGGEADGGTAAERASVHARGRRVATAAAHARHRSQQRALARSVCAEHAEDLAGPYREREPAQHGIRARPVPEPEVSTTSPAPVSAAGDRFRTFPSPWVVLADNMDSR